MHETAKEIIKHIQDENPARLFRSVGKELHSKLGDRLKEMKQEIAREMYGNLDEANTVDTAEIGFHQSAPKQEIRATIIVPEKDFRKYVSAAQTARSNGSIGGFDAPSENTQKQMRKRGNWEGVSFLTLVFDIDSANTPTRKQVVARIKDVLGLSLSEEVDTDEIQVYEVTAKRKKVVRGGKRIIKFSCPPGYKKQGRRKCVKVTGSDLAKKKRAARKAARKRRGKKSQINRNRRRSNRKRKTFGL